MEKGCGAEAARSSRAMKKIVIALVLLGWASHVLAQLGSSEDASRFKEEPYEKAEPGLLPPSAYIEMAKKALHRQIKDVRLTMYSDPAVTRRLYHDAPPKDRDIICVEFVFRDFIKGGAYHNGGKSSPIVPAILVLFRKDLSKIYVNVNYYHF